MCEFILTKDKYEELEGTGYAPKANYLQENMKNLGVLKAVGYTSRQLIRSLLVQFFGLFLIAALERV